MSSLQWFHHWNTKVWRFVWVNTTAWKVLFLVMTIWVRIFYSLEDFGKKKVLKKVIYITTYSLLCSCDLSSEVPSLSTSFWIVLTVEPNIQEATLILASIVITHKNGKKGKKNITYWKWNSIITVALHKCRDFVS